MAAKHEACHEKLAVLLVVVYLAWAVLSAPVSADDAASVADSAVPAAASNEVIIARFTLNSPPTPFGWTNFAALDVGDVDGDGQTELVLAFPARSGPVEGSSEPIKASLPTEEQAAPFAVEVFRLVAAWAGQDFRLLLAPLAQAGSFDLTVNGLTVADLYPQGPPEIWFAYLPKVGCLEFDGTAFQVKDSWQTWANKPVVLSRYGPVVTSGFRPAVAPGPTATQEPPRGQEKLLALAYRYSPDVAVGLVTVDRPVKCPSKEKDVPGESFFSPADHFVAADLDGDGKTELLATRSRYSRQFEPRPFVVTDLWSGRTELTLPNVLPDELTAGDVDNDGAVEVVLAENQADQDGWPEQAVVRVLRLDRGALREVKRFYYPDAWVSDLAYGDADNNGQGDLAVALVERVGGTSNVVLKTVFPYLGAG